MPRNCATRPEMLPDMTTSVFAATIVVNNERDDIGDNRCQARDVREVTTIADRIDRICVARAEDGKPLSLRELSRRSDLSENQIAVTVKRLREGANRNIGLDVLEKIATGGKVSLAWLVAGVGPMDAGKETGDRLTTVIEEARRDGAEPEFLATWRPQRPDRGKQTFGELWYQLQADLAAWRRAPRERANATSDLAPRQKEKVFSDELDADYAARSEGRAPSAPGPKKAPTKPRAKR